jgi:nucleotide-binding universal stress UspA family protein
MPENAAAPIVVGVEDNQAGYRALDWAIDEAARRTRGLRLVHALDWPAAADRDLGLRRPDDAWRDAVRAAGRRVLEVAGEYVHSRRPGIPVEARLVDGVPQRVLRDAAAEASTVVLGSRRLSSVHEALTTGSVAVPVTAHARCPVVIVRYPEHLSAAEAQVVVGFDGSEPSERALAWAFDEAARRDATLVAVQACPVPLTPVAATMAEEAMTDARIALQTTLSRWGAKYPDVPSRSQVAMGHPVRTLADLAGEALCLVVGTRGRGGFVSMLLGSVSHGLIHHARCPLVVVPGHPDDA